MHQQLGAGSFGKVVGDGDNAIKSFKALTPLVAELFVARYLSNTDRKGSEYVIRVKKRNLSKLTMTTERWYCSLQHVLWYARLSHAQASQLFKQILLSVSYIELHHLVQADIKPDNILVNKDFTKAILTDFGISSSSGCARVRLTTKAYSPSEYVNHRAHDAYAVALVGLQLLYGYNVSEEYKTRSQLRKEIMMLVTDPIDRKCFLGLVQDVPERCWTAKMVLEKMYGKIVHYPKIPRPIVIDIPEADRISIKYHVQTLCERFRVRRWKRCSICCESILSRLDPTCHTKMYIAAMVYVFRCVFGFTETVKKEDRMTEIDAAIYCRESVHSVTKAIDTTLEQRDVVNLMFYH